MSWLLVLDAFLAALAIETAGAVMRTIHPSSILGLEGTTVASAFTVLATALGTYMTGLDRPTVILSRASIWRRAAIVGALAGLTLLLAQYYAWYKPTGRIAPLVVGGLVGTLLIASRLLARRAVLRAPRVPVVIVGTGPTASVIAELMNSEPATRRVAVGYVAAGDASLPSADDLPLLGAIEQLPDVCREYGISQVLVATAQAADSLLDVMPQLSERGVVVQSAHDVVMSVSGRLPFDMMDGGWMLDTMPRLHAPGVRETKQVIDMGFALAGLAVFAVLFPALYFAVKLSSPGPFLFVQDRVGEGGRVFKLLKIRTMTHNPRAGERWAAKTDARVTAVGAVLRKTRLDELPQLINVLRGEMSIVGPRPEQPGIAKRIEAEIPAFRFRTLVKPGITGWAQINYGYAASVEESGVKLSYDLFYLHRFGPRMDLDIIMRTFFVMLARIGSR